MRFYFLRPRRSKVSKSRRVMNDINLDKALVQECRLSPRWLQRPKGHREALGYGIRERILEEEGEDTKHTWVEGNKDEPESLLRIQCVTGHLLMYLTWNRKWVILNSSRWAKAISFVEHEWVCFFVGLLYLGNVQFSSVFGIISKGVPILKVFWPRFCPYILCKRCLLYCLF